jgi:hypothetical protein
MMHIAQAAAAQATEAGRSGVSVVLDAGIIGLIVTNSGLLIKALIDRKAVKAALDVAETAIKEAKDEGDGRLKPGEGPTCREHGEAIASLVEFKGTAADALKRIEGKVDRLLERK